MAQPILIVGALKDEISELKKRLSEELAARSVILAYTGIGEEATHKGLERLVAETEVRAVIGVGYAGALVEGLKPGDLIAAQEICRDDSGRTIPPVNSDHDLLQVAQRTITEIRAGRLVTVQTACINAVQKKTTGERHQAIAVDMESAALASFCRERSIPFLVLRSILDPMEATVPDPAAFMNSQQGVSKKKLASYVMKNPQAVWQLPQLALHAKRARQSLNEAIPLLVREIFMSFP